MKLESLHNIRKNGFRIRTLSEAFAFDVQTIPFPDEEVESYLDRTHKREKEKGEKFKRPYIHRGNIDIKDTSGRSYDLDALRQKVQERPKQLLKQNEKMKHSDGTETVYFNLGLPALKGLAVDEETGQFVIVNTCPGAGECKIYCYAMKGGYVQWAATSMAQTRVLNFLLNDPSGFESKLSSEISKQKKKFAKKDTKVVVRWHDAGDFFSPDYREMAFRIANKFPDVSFYAYTKVAANVQADLPDNFLMNFSQGALSREEKQVDTTKSKHSKVVPKEMFYDLIARDGRKIIKDDKGRTQFKGNRELQEFKKRMADEYDLDIDTILTYDEMMSKNLGREPKWNIIVMPGDGDDSANNPGVLGTYLLFH